MVNKRFLVWTAAICAAASIAAGTAVLNSVPAVAEQGDFSVEGIKVSNGSVSVENVTSDPYIYIDEASGGSLTNASEKLDTEKLESQQPLLFTAKYPYTTTHRVGNYIEYAVEYSENKYSVTEINAAGDGETYIPVGGYVLSVPESSSFTAKEGDVLTLEGKLTLPEMAVESDKGARVAIDALNSNRSMPMVVYYDYDFGDKTGTNAYGTELSAIFDEESASFEVVSFRGFGVGDGSGIEIPENGFVLSAYGVGYRGIFLENNRFSLGDKLTMVGFDYIRFGGDPVTYTYNYDYYDENDPNDACHTNPGRMETETTPFAAYRGENQTIIYHDGWSYQGSAGTGANVYGFEAAVDASGTVVERGVTVTSIPDGGYVISGHGTGRDFIRASVPLGASIILDQDKKEFAVTTSLNSFYVNTKSTVDEIISDAETKIKQLYDVDADALEAKIDEARALLETLEETKNNIEKKMEEGTWSNEEKTREMMAYNTAKLEAEATAYEILALSAESKPVTARAVWHRPTEKTLKSLTETLDIYEEIGINLVFVETFYNVYSLFKSDNVQYHKDFEGASYEGYPDYLTAFTELAAERGIEVHAWVENFYVGLTTDIEILQEHPDWIMYNSDGTYIQKNEGGDYIFIDPANPKVQDFLITYYKEMLQKVPKIKGINLDYIRYPVSDKAEDTGYTKYAMMEFAESVGVTRLDESMSIDKMISEFNKWVLDDAYNLNAAENYEKWCDYRVNAVTSFVERVYEEVKGDGDLLLSTAVFSSASQTLDSKKQDWKTWIRNGWIDIATPMAYYDAAADVLSGVSDMILAAGANCYYYTGLASSYRGLPAYENVYQTEASYLGGANGYVIFCSTQIIGHKDVQEMLKAGVNSRPAVLPHASTEDVLKAYFDRILDRADRLYIPVEGMTTEGKTALKAEFDKILAMDMQGYDALKAVQTAVNNLYKSNNLSAYAKGFSARRIQETLTELYDLLETKAQKEYEGGDTPTPPDSGDSSTSSSENSGTETNPERKGCGSVVSACALSTVFAAGVALFLKKKRKI